jgi:anaerobic sulfite reductase subunit A
MMEQAVQNVIRQQSFAYSSLLYQLPAKQKEVLIAINETLFYYTEDQTTIPKGPEKEILIFLRSCDLHAVKRLDQIYLKNGNPDFYYNRVREKAKFILMGCPSTCESGFCVSMGTNTTQDYDAYLKMDGDKVYADIKDETLSDFAAQASAAQVKPDFVTENVEKVTLPKKLSNESFTKDIWQEYGARCIGCGRCNFACPTCTCFTMQDIFYKDNPKVGERRRVWASCQVEGFDEIAGGIKFRKTQGDQMRFKVMHKIYDFEKRFGYPMCVGCGRCDDICPEYISYSNLVNRLAKEEEEG